MKKSYRNHPMLKYSPENGTLNARLFLSTPELETELEEIISASFEPIGKPDKKETLTHKTTTYFLNKEPALKKSALDLFKSGIEKLFGKETELVCTVSYIHDSSQGLPRMDIKVNLSVKGSNAERNKELIRNLGEKLDGIYEKIQTQYCSGPGSGI